MPLHVIKAGSCPALSLLRFCLVTNFHCGPVIFHHPAKRDYSMGVSGLVFPSCRLYEVMNSITILSFFHQTLEQFTNRHNRSAIPGGFQGRDCYTLPLAQPLMFLASFVLSCTLFVNTQVDPPSRVNSYCATMFQRNHAH